MMKKLHITILFLMCGLTALAQDFEIVSVEYLPFDLSAVEEKVVDANGHECAVIRVATQKLTPKQRESFNFEPDWGSKVVQRADRDGEIWLWVSPGLKHLRIKGGELGQQELHLVNHKISIESSHTYKIIIRGDFKTPSNNTNYSTQALFVLTDEKTDMQGVVDVDGNVVIPYKYESLSDMDGSLKSHFVYTKNSREGILDKNGNVCVPNLYEAVFADESNDVVLARRDGKIGLIDFSGNIVLQFGYDVLAGLNGNLIAVGKTDKAGNRFGIIDLSKKKEILPCEYELVWFGTIIYEQHWNGYFEVENTSPSNLTAVRKNGKIGFVDEKGQVVIPCMYESVFLQRDSSGELFGLPNEEIYYLDEHFNAYVFQDGKAVFYKNGKAGLLDEKGNEVVPAIWNSIRNYPSSEIRCHFMPGENFYINLPKKCTYDYATAVKEGKGSVLLDKNGMVCTGYYEDIWEEEGFVVYKENDKYGLLNLNTGKKLTKAQYDELYCASEGFIIFKAGGKYGYLDRYGIERFKDYDDVSPFKNGYATVIKNRKCGYVPFNYGTTIPCIYDYATPFNEEGLAVVKKDGKYGVINVRGKTIVPFDYDYIEQDEKEAFFVLVLGSRWGGNAKYGAADFDGNEIVSPKYPRNALQYEIAKYHKSNQTK